MQSIVDLSELAYHQLLQHQTSASIARASLSQIEELVATIYDNQTALSIHRIAVGVEQLAFTEMERQWVDYQDIADQYWMPQ